MSRLVGLLSLMWCLGCFFHAPDLVSGAGKSDPKVVGEKNIKNSHREKVVKFFWCSCES